MQVALERFGARLVEKLRRSSATTPSRWALIHRLDKDNKPWSFDRFPWTREMHDSTCNFNVGQKAAQLGYTETVLNVGFFTNDMLSRDVLYVLPSQTPDASVFSSGRFDAALEDNDYLSAMYGDARNVGHKRAGRANFFIRGSHSRAGLKSVPVGTLILDELDEMCQENIPLAYERVSGQVEQTIWAISTPTANNHGINELFLQSTQEHFLFPCPGCSRWIELSFPGSLVIIGDDPEAKAVDESYIKCDQCGHILPHADKISWLSRGRWVPSVEDRSKRGFYVNQLYSTTTPPGKIAAAWLRAQRNPADEQEFWNSKMGLPHEVKGARVLDSELDACLGDHLQDTQPVPGRFVTMGVDVGKICHFEVIEWSLGQTIATDVNTNARGRVLLCGFVRNFEDLDPLMIKFDVNSCVVDAHPERRAAFQFSQRFWGLVKMCIYGRGVAGKQIHEQRSDIGEPLITVDRTSWLDMSLGRFRNKTILLPRNLPFDYREHTKAVARIWSHDMNGNPTASYVTEGKRADHHAHARNYSEIALALVGTIGSTHDIAEDVI